MEDLIQRFDVRCVRCGWKWYSPSPHPKACPHCHSTYWDVERKNKQQEETKNEKE